MKRIALIILGVLASAIFVQAADDLGRAKHEEKQQFMRQKLGYSQVIMEGLVLEKFDLITTNAAIMRNMNLTNTFLMLKNPLYMQNITNFQANIDSLTKAAKEKNLDKASAAFSEVVNSCVACHQQFRRDQFNNAQK